MSERSNALKHVVMAVLERYLRQNRVAQVEAGSVALVAERLAGIAASRAELPVPAAMGEPPEMTADEVEAIVTEALSGLAGREALVVPVKQLAKGCFQATRRECRDSYREVDRAGVCRRQLLAKARERVSGTHCVDCPYWTQLTAAEHAALLAKAWGGAGGAEELAANREIFLPEDFRLLRRIATEASPSNR